MNKKNSSPLKLRIIPVILPLVLLCTAALGQAGRSGRQPLNNGPISDSVIVERLVQLALKGPVYDVSVHQISAAEYKVIGVKKSWFNLLAISLNYNDQTFAKPPAGTSYANVYPKYFFGLTIPIGTIVSKGSEIKAAREDVKIAHDNQEILARTIRADVRTKYAQYKNATELILVQTQVENDFSAMYNKALQKFQDGTLTVETFNDASRSFNLEKTKRLQAQLQQELIKIDLEKTIGVPLETVMHQ